MTSQGKDKSQRAIMDRMNRVLSLRMLLSIYVQIMVALLDLMNFGTLSKTRLLLMAAATVVSMELPWHLSYCDIYRTCVEKAEKVNIRIPTYH